MSITRSPLLLVLFSFSALACASGPTGFIAGDGGNDGGAALADSGPEAEAKGSDCPAFCDYAAEHGVTCDRTKCTAACKTGKTTAASSNCADEFQAVIDCAMGPGTGTKKPLITCTSTGIANVANCNAAQTALSACIKPAGEVDAGPTKCTLSAPLKPNTTFCDSCMQDYCCSVTNACFSASECAALAECTFACPTGTGAASCVDACNASHPAGGSKMQAVTQCLVAHCATPCFP